MFQSNCWRRNRSDLIRIARPGARSSRLPDSQLDLSERALRKCGQSTADQSSEKLASALSEGYFSPFAPHRSKVLKRASLAAASVSNWPASRCSPSGKTWKVHCPLAFLIVGPGAGCLSLFIDLPLKGRILAREFVYAIPSPGRAIALKVVASFLELSALSTTVRSWKASNRSRR